METKKETRGNPHDHEKIAKQLVEWSRLETSLNLNEFCGNHRLAPSLITTWAKQKEFFRIAYEEAKANLGSRREKALLQGALHSKCYDLNAKTYDHFMFDQWKIEKEWEKRLDQEIENAKSENDKGRLAEQLQAIKESLLRKSNDCT